METLYRVEFRENSKKNEAKRWHLTDVNKTHLHPENTNGWVTIMDSCSDLEFKIFQAYLERYPNKEWTKNYLLESASELKSFMENLHKIHLDIKKTT